MLIGVFGGGLTWILASLTSNEEPLTQEQMSDVIGNLNLISSFYYQDGTKISDVNTDELRIVKTFIRNFAICKRWNHRYRR